MMSKVITIRTFPGFPATFTNVPYPHKKVSIYDLTSWRFMLPMAINQILSMSYIRYKRLDKNQRMHKIKCNLEKKLIFSINRWIKELELNMKILLFDKKENFKLEDTI